MNFRYLSRLTNQLCKNRSFTKTSLRHDSKVTETDHYKLHSHKVNNLEKRFLVWTGKFKSVDEVPAYVGQNMMERSRNMMRIRIANCMMAATVLGCILMIYMGKQDAKRGESVAKQNLEWHRQYNETETQKEVEGK